MIYDQRDNEFLDKLNTSKEQDKAKNLKDHEKKMEENKRLLKSKQSLEANEILNKLEYNLTLNLSNLNH